MTEPSANDTRKNDIRPHLAWACLAIALITAWRIACLAFNSVDLFVDESQYWLWGQELALGYFSKPPMIGWIVRLSTELGHSDAPFWVRLPTSIGYGVAGLCIAVAAQTVWRDPRAAWAGAAFATLPGVSILALFVSTDDILLPLFALALLAFLRLSERSSLVWTLTLGGAIGLGLLTKYAMAYFIPLAILARITLPACRVRWRNLVFAVLLALAIVSPNLIWNLSHGFITLSHTAGNAGWNGIAWNWRGAAEFAASQVAALGPIFGPAFLLAFLLKRGSPATGLAAVFSLPIFAVVLTQAVIRDANGNWAAPAFVAATILAAGWFAVAIPRLFATAMVLNATIAVLLPLATIWPERVVFNGRSVFDRALGLSEFSREAIQLAKTQGVSTIIAEDRDLLAELVYRSKGSGVSVYSWPQRGAPTNHYALTRSVPNGLASSILVTRRALPSPCVEAAEDILVWSVDAGALRRAPISFYLLDRDCWSEG